MTMCSLGRRWVHLKPIAAAMLAIFALSSCTVTAPSSYDLLGYKGLGESVRRYYEGRAHERNATCVLPEMVNITGATIVSETDDQFVADIRYLYTTSSGSNDRRFPGFGGTGCRDFETRRFTFEKLGGDQARVVSMSGGQRGGVPLPGSGS